MILEKFSLAGKIALVTGARGILGAAMAHALAEAGADLALVPEAIKLRLWPNAFDGWAGVASPCPPIWRGWPRAKKLFNKPSTLMVRWIFL